MAAKTKGSHRKFRDDRYFDYPVKDSTIIYEGALTCLLNGYAVPGADIAGYTFAGVPEADSDNSSGANGAIRTRLWRKRQWLVGCTGADQTWVGKTAFIVDDNTVAITGVTNNVILGEVTELVSSTQVWVDDKK